jgi:(2Fe-2S) ferredoxin
MLITIEGSFIGGQLSKTGKLKNLQIKTSDSIAGGQADRVQQIKIPKNLRSLLEQVLKSSTYLKLKVKTGHKKSKAVSILTAPGAECWPLTNIPSSVTKIQVCSKGACHKRGSKQLCTALQTMLQDRNLHNSIAIEEVGCLKECKQSPNVRFKPSGDICHQASPHKVWQLLESMLPQ